MNSKDKDRPLGGDSFEWNNDGLDGNLRDDHLSDDAFPAGTSRPSQAVPTPLDGAMPSALGPDRRPPELRARDVDIHRLRIDRARRHGLLTTEEALDRPSDLDDTWSN